MAMPYWDRYDEGVFIGGRYAGSPMHVDQIMWSNVGKSFGGAKLLAIWASGEASREIFDQHHYTLFTPPLGADADEDALLGLVRADTFLGYGRCTWASGTPRDHTHQRRAYTYVFELAEYSIDVCRLSCTRDWGEQLVGYELDSALQGCTCHLVTTNAHMRTGVDVREAAEWSDGD